MRTADFEPWLVEALHLRLMIKFSTVDEWSIGPARSIKGLEKESKDDPALNKTRY